MTRAELVGYLETIGMRKPGPLCRAGEMYFGAKKCVILVLFGELPVVAFPQLGSECRFCLDGVRVGEFRRMHDKATSIVAEYVKRKKELDAQMAKLGDDMRGRLVELFPGHCRI